MNSPLQLDQLAFTNVSIQASLPAFDADHIENIIGYSSSPNKTNYRNWQVRIKVEMRGVGGKKSTYFGTVECAGIFTVAESWPEQEIEKLATVNGLGILYAAVREMVCNITARGPWPMVTLPSQSFLASYEESKKQQLTSK